MAHGDGSGEARQGRGDHGSGSAAPVGDGASRGAPATRRQLLQRLGSAAVVGGPVLVAGWWLTLGARAAMPPRPDSVLWLVGPEQAFGDQRSHRIRTPAGRELVIRPVPTTDGEWIAMSTTCPHLGCQVRWLSGARRYECPCHAATFDERGEPLSGPPLEAAQPLAHYPVLVEAGRLYVELPPWELDSPGASPVRRRTTRSRHAAPHSDGGGR